jgi:methyl-accepting chemotaxis protein
MINAANRANHYAEKLAEEEREYQAKIELEYQIDSLNDEICVLRRDYHLTIQSYRSLLKDAKNTTTALKSFVLELIRAAKGEYFSELAKLKTKIDEANQELARLT